MAIGILFLIIAVVAAAFILGVVAVGLNGKGSTDHPRTAHWLRDTGKAFNGQGEPPARVSKLFR